MTKKAVVTWIAILALLFFIVPFAKADDGAVNDVFWVKNQGKVTCVSLTTPAQFPDGSFLVFDYSPAVGEQLGKPWAPMAQGKCYQVDGQGGAIFVILPSSGLTPARFTDYQTYTPDQDIPDAFCKTLKCAYSWDSPSGKQSVAILEFDPLDNSGQMGLTREDAIYDTGIRATDVLPTRYGLGVGATWFSSTVPPEEEKILSDPSFTNAKNLYIALAQNLQATLATCDTRIRTEYQLEVQEPNYAVVDIVWRLRDGSDVSLSKTLPYLTIVPDYSYSDQQNQVADELRAIGLMGCQTAFGQFVQLHKSDFLKMDQWAGALAQEYASTSAALVANVVFANDPGITSEILAFAGNSSSTNVAAPSASSVPATTLDEPTPAKKFDVLFNSPNPFFRIYVWLPILSLLGIVALAIFLRRRK